MKKQLIFLLFISGTISIFAQQPYYADVDFTKTGDALLQELSDKVTRTHTNFLSYTPGIWEASKITDIDPENTENVILIYGYENGSDTDITNDRNRNKDLNGGDAGEWNREHTYPRSLGDPNLGSIGPGSDAHHLRPSDITRNSNRGNRKFGDGSGTSRITADGFWYPGDEWKGDIARMMLYMYIRYGDRCLPTKVIDGTINENDPNMINLLLEWNEEDPVSVLEDARNTYHDTDNMYAQGNRNPFIDNPNLASQIWGGPVAEDRWIGGTNDDEDPTIPMNIRVLLENPTRIDISWTASTDNVGIYNYDIYIDDVLNSSSRSTTATIENLSSETTYSFRILARDTSGNISELSSAVNGTTSVDNTIFEENFENCSSETILFTSYSETSDKNWECQTRFGQNNSASYQMNGFEEDVASKDWLISTSAIDFDLTDSEKLSLFLAYRFGSTPLELLYSENYLGEGDPSIATWIDVPGVEIPTDITNSTTREIYFEDLDISALSGTGFIAFRYYSNGEPTRWTVDSFKITRGNLLGAAKIQTPNFYAYPNPSSGVIKIPRNITTYDTIKIIDIQGRTVWNLIPGVNKKQTSKTITVKNLPKGLLIIQYKTGAKIKNEKILVH